MKNEKGFTMMELLIVVAIIGILAAVATTAYVGSTKKAARSEAYSNLESLRLLEEQFFAERATYTASLGVGITPATPANQTANLTAIKTTAANSLPGFNPGNDSSFSYRTISNVALNPAAITVPFNPATTVVQTPCFVAVATGILGTRVCPNAADCDIFAIDCNNNRNF